MATLSGHIAQQGFGGMEPTENLSSSLWEYGDSSTYLNLDTAELSARTDKAGPRTYNTVSPTTWSISGHIVYHYGDLYYDSIHVDPQLINLGNLLTTQTRQFYVFNAYRTSQTLESVTQESADGINLTEPVTPSYTMAPYEELTYTVQVTLNGPPVIDADIIISFSHKDFTVNIQGQRVVTWTWIPENNFTEHLKWLTHVLKTRQGEQRISLREAPRQVFEYEFVKEDHELSEIKTIAESWTFRQWGLPIWHEASIISATAGDTAINFDTSYADYRSDNGNLAVIWKSSNDYEPVEISNVRSDGLDLVRELGSSWTNARIMPLRYAYSPEGIKINRDKGIAQIRAIFEVTDNIDLSSSVGYPQHNGYDILTDGKIKVDSLNQQIQRQTTQFDNGQGPVTIETGQNYNDFMDMIGKFNNNSKQLWEWRQWLHTRRGKLKPFYLPSWNKDIEITQSVGSTDTTFDIKYIGISIYAKLPKAIRIELTDGTVMYRTIESAGMLGDHETITVDSSLGQDLDPVDFRKISYMHLVRFDADMITIKHDGPKITKCSVPTIEVPE